MLVQHSNTPSYHNKSWNLNQTDVAPPLLPLQTSPAGNHLEALPSGLHNLRQLSHLGLALNYYKIWRHAVPCFASLASSLQELELQHTATVLDDAAGFLAAVGQLTALTSLCAGSNQLSVLPEAWQQLKRLKVRFRAQPCNTRGFCRTRKHLPGRVFGSSTCAGLQLRSQLAETATP